MICHICKDKVASIRLKEIINDEVTELHLCQGCYEEREREGTGVKEASTSEMIKSLTGEMRKKADAKPTACSTCGTTEADLRENGRLGCSDCYRTFTVALQPILSKVQGSVEHRGKLPHAATKNLDLKNELRRLQEDLREAILSENYERAAKLRDRIKRFEEM